MREMFERRKIKIDGTQTKYKLVIALLELELLRLFAADETKLVNDR